MTKPEATEEQTAKAVEGALVSTDCIVCGQKAHGMAICNDDRCALELAQG